MKSPKRKLEHLLKKVISAALVPVRKVHPELSRTSPQRPLFDVRPDFGIDQTQDFIRQRILSGEPFLAGRFGSIELEAIRSFYFRSQSLIMRMNAYVEYGEAPWWRSRILDQLSNNAGLFPRTIETTEKFCQSTLDVIKDIDLLGSWLPGEWILREELKNSKICHLSALVPFLSSAPWTSSLAGKRVCVVHPFARTIEKQFANRQKLFDDKSILPSFDLVTVKAVQSIANNKTTFKDWFEALGWMESEALRKKFDVAIIGCGAYGLPLAARLKIAGKQAIHLGGGTQILFGIKGRRWDQDPAISKLYNDYWVRPSKAERPDGAEQVEGACYW